MGLPAALQSCRERPGWSIAAASHFPACLYNKILQSCRPNKLPRLPSRIRWPDMTSAICSKLPDADPAPSAQISVSCLMPHLGRAVHWTFAFLHCISPASRLLIGIVSKLRNGGSPIPLATAAHKTWFRLHDPIHLARVPTRHTGLLLCFGV